VGLKAAQECSGAGLNPSKSIKWFFFLYCPHCESGDPSMHTKTEIEERI